MTFPCEEKVYGYKYINKKKILVSPAVNENIPKKKKFFI